MTYYFSLNLSSDDFLLYYQGVINTIVVTTENGLRVEFPAMHLRRYFLSGGIKGRFCLKTKDNKFLSLDKIS
jgi:hypothetical protein